MIDNGGSLAGVGGVQNSTISHEMADRLAAAVAYCRKRLRRPEYEAELERILAGDRDAQIANPDRTEMTHG
jgi:hypothetical protein